MSSLKNKLKKLSFFTHYPKKHETLTINNATEEYPSKKEMWEEWLKEKENSFAFDNPIYTATNGSASISATLIENFQPSSNKIVTLTGDDGSLYTETTNSDGVVTFNLIGYGDITYTATYNDFTDTCIVNGLNNRIKITLNCSRTSEKDGTIYWDILYFFVHEEGTSNSTPLDFTNAPLTFTVPYRSRTTSSGSFSNQTKTYTNSDIKTAHNRIEYRKYYSWMTTSSSHCLACPTSSKSIKTPGNWKFKPIT